MRQRAHRRAAAEADAGGSVSSSPSSPASALPSEASSSRLSALPPAHLEEPGVAEGGPHRASWRGGRRCARSSRVRPGVVVIDAARQARRYGSGRLGKIRGRLIQGFSRR
jgi:hypothetical protein